MADKKRLLDVWIIEIDMVYRDVPFAIVTDWLEQGRLLPEDKVRVAGGKAWHELSQVPVFAPYLPRPEPLAVGDQAEALEPVDLGFVPTRRVEEEDEDVDMIPLIDISLVLLIFFMMTATISSGFLPSINTPSARHQFAIGSSDSLWVGIDSKSGGGKIERGNDGKAMPWYGFGKGNQELVPLTTDIGPVLGALTTAVASESGEVTIRLRADRGLPIETIKDTTLQLHGLEERLNRERGAWQMLRFTITGEVTEPQEK